MMLVIEAYDEKDRTEVEQQKKVEKGKRQKKVKYEKKR